MPAPPKRFVSPIGYLICVSGFLLCVIGFYPGYMTVDSVYQLTQARAWAFTDWHPPLMAAIWGLIDRVVPGPLGMLLLHNVLFWGGLAVFWHMTNRRSLWLGLSLVTIGFVPTMLALLSTILKDVTMGGSLLLASALLYVSQRTSRRAALLFSIPFVFLAYGVRQNAAPAILPLAVWTGFIACRIFTSREIRSRRRVLPIVLGVAYFLLLTAAVLLTTRALTGGRSLHIVQMILLHDLTAISKEKGEPLFPDYILDSGDFSLQRVVNAYIPDRPLPLIWRLDGRPAPMRPSADREQIGALRAKWLEVVPFNPTIYLRHRWRGFRSAVGLGRQACDPFFEVHQQPEGYSANSWRIHRYLRSIFDRLRDSFLFRGATWLLLSFALLCVALVGRLRGDLELVFVLSMSGFLYAVTYFFISTGCTFRFYWWTAVASLVALCFAVVESHHIRSPPAPNGRAHSN